MWFHGKLQPQGLVMNYSVTGFSDLSTHSASRFRMRKLLMRIVKSLASMSMCSHDDDDDTSHRYRDIIPESVPGPSRETAGSSAIAMRELLPAPSATNICHVRNEDAPSRSLSESQGLHDARERVHVERDSAEHRKRSAFSKDQGSKYAREGEATKTRDEYRPPKEEDQYWYDWDNTDDKRDTPRGAYYPSLKQNIDISGPPLACAKGAEPIVPASANSQHVYEAQSIELSDLRREHRAALEKQRKLANNYESLQQQYEERLKKINSVRHERQKVNAHKEEIEDAYAVLVQQYEEQTKELNAVHQERHAAIQRKQKAEEDYRTLWWKYEAQRNDCNTIYHKYCSSNATLEQRTSELQGIRRFFMTADKFSGSSEVVKSLWKLNEEVQQDTTFMAKWAMEKFMLETRPTDEMATQTIEQTRTSEMLGMRLMQLLGTKNHRNNSILVGMAFQAYLIYELYCIASHRGTGQEEQSHNMYIDGIYRRMWDAEGQAISGNWGALTRAYTLSDPELGRRFQMAIISGFSDILLAAGCTMAQVDITSGLRPEFAEKIAHFISLAGEVNKIIGVGVISEDFEVRVVWPEAVFDEKTMEGPYNNGDRVERGEEHKEIVLCATRLGLVQRMRVAGGRDGKPTDSEFIHIKPKVALVSMIDIIDE